MVCKLVIDKKKVDCQLSALTITLRNHLPLLDEFEVLERGTGLIRKGSSTRQSKKA